MRIVMMESCHVPQVAALEKLCFSDPWSENSVASELSNELSCWLVALDEDTVAGYVGSQTVLGETPEYRRKGIAKALVSALVEQLKQRESHCLTLEVRLSNEPARALYASLGFVQIGRRPGYYHNPKEDGLILRKEWEI